MQARHPPLAHNLPLCWPELRLQPASTDWLVRSALRAETLQLSCRSERKRMGLCPNANLSEVTHEVLREAENSDRMSFLLFAVRCLLSAASLSAVCYFDGIGKFFGALRPARPLPVSPARPCRSQSCHHFSVAAAAAKYSRQKPGSDALTKRLR